MSLKSTSTPKLVMPGGLPDEDKAESFRLMSLLFLFAHPGVIALTLILVSRASSPILGGFRRCRIPLIPLALVSLSASAVLSVPRAFRFPCRDCRAFDGAFLTPPSSRFMGIISSD
ncbi:hypothetical protein M404DRAFT_22214 [Pisolithus tinctorius Marx 270]|uniref:Uncharacterized protein n=1 Tax=Pisolithus tinctorius Marx 270 TaxID=870435 RepID=A0A0C3JIP9_PISTI|nr:hypothetical protein M404DRAFT_22214 [Pisolithus tinctorius Marx 270]